MINVVVSGTGKMAQQVLQTLCQESDLRPVGVVGRSLAAGASVPLPDGSGVVPVGNDPAALFHELRPDVVIDFTNAEWVPVVVRAALAAGVRPVIGTTGLSDPLLEELAQGCRERGLGAVVASNFAIGAVLMVHMARLAAPFFEHVEIIELHHDQKADAPSGTAITTAREMLAARERPFTVPPTINQTLPGSRGAELGGVNIHSVRLQGLVAHQEVLFGGLGQTLTVRHDSTGRESFMPGVLLAVREVMQRRELVIGLDRLIGLR